MWSLRLFGTDGGIYMSVEACLALFAFGFYAFFDVLAECFRYFYNKNKEYRDRKQNKKSKKEEVEK